MKISIIGAGNIGALLAHKLSAAGHEVRLANSRGAETLQEIVQGSDIQAVTKEAAVQGAEVIVLSLPFSRNPELAGLLQGVPASTIVVDTSNYYPARDGLIEEVDNGKLETLWVSEQLGRPLIKAWNALLVQTLDEAASEPGSPGRIAIPIAGYDLDAKRTVAELVSATGFDSVDAGGLEESWRFQPGSPAYCTELPLNELQVALAAADKARIPHNRDAIMQSVMDGKVEFVRAAMVANNRKLSV